MAIFWWLGGISLKSYLTSQEFSVYKVLKISTYYIVQNSKTRDNVSIIFKYRNRKQWVSPRRFRLIPTTYGLMEN